MNLENIYYALILADDFQSLFICCVIACIKYENLLKAKDTIFIFPSVTKLSNKGIIGSSHLQEMHLQIQMTIQVMYYLDNWSDFPFSSNLLVFWD